MTVSVAERLCRFYQSLYPSASYPEQSALVDLHRAGSRGSGDMGAYLRAYFDHQYAKAAGALARFTAVTTEWHGGRALDFGAGAGGLTARLREHCPSAVGIDLDAEKLAFARAEVAERKIDNIEFVCYPGGLPVPLPGASFDSITCVDVVEHLPKPAGFVAEFRRLLRPGGLLLVSFGPPWRHPHGKHMWSQLPGWWTHLLFPESAVMRVAGFGPDSTWAQLGLHRLTVGRFERIMASSGFVPVYTRASTVKRLPVVGRLPVVRELLTAEVVGVYRNP